MLDIARDRRKTFEKKRKKKRKRRQSQITTINIILLLIFYIKKLYFARKHIWKNIVYIVTFVLQFFRVADYWKGSNKLPASI